MIKLGIFGDSFAADMEPQYYASLGWVEQVRREHPTWQVDNWAVSGSSLWYTYHMFEPNHSQYTHVCVFVTEWDRRTFMVGDEFYHVPGVGHLEHHMNRYPRGVARALLDHWVLVDQDRERRQLHELMVKTIRQSRPDCLIIPCFDPVQTSRAPSPTGITLDRIANMDIDHYWPHVEQDQRPSIYQKWQDRRANHMNERNLQLLAATIGEWVETHRLDWDSKPWGPDLTKPKDYYFKPY